MYKCCITKKCVPVYTPANKVILEIRPIRYKNMYQGGPARRGRAPEGPKLVSWSNGWEIVKEGFMSPQVLHQAPKLEDLIARLEDQQPIERINMINKRPKKKGKYKRRDTKVFRLKIVRTNEPDEKSVKEDGKSNG